MAENNLDYSLWVVKCKPPASFYGQGEGCVVAVRIKFVQVQPMLTFSLDASEAQQRTLTQLGHFVPLNIMLASFVN